MSKTEKQLDKFLRKKPKLGRGVYLAKTAVVIGDVTLGAHSSVWYGAVLRGDINRIVVSHHTNIQANAVLPLGATFAGIVATGSPLATVTSSMRARSGTKASWA